MSVTKYGNDLPEERIDVHNCPESPDLGSVHTEGTPEMRLAAHSAPIRASGRVR